MIFVGDIAMPDLLTKSFKSLNPNFFSNKSWFGNIEGSIVKNTNNKYQKSRSVFNDINSVKRLIDTFDFKGFALANNHIFDISDLETTLYHLNSLSIPFCGIGKNIKEASKPLLIEEDGYKIVILNFGWEVIQCDVASNNLAGVNPLTRDHVLDSVREAVKDYPDAKIITYMHWSYELEAEPQPFERELAKMVIDLGAWGVIGSHPHRIGGFETYKGRPIVYSLGNWMFRQKYYFDGRLAFPDFCNLELAFEWDLANDDYKFHFFDYNRDTSELTYLQTEGKDSPTMISHTPFLGLSDKEYKSWYKKNHYHKNKGLPIYYWDDSNHQIHCKNNLVSLRARLMKIILNKGK